MYTIRPCRNTEHATMLAIVNAAAEAYRGAIPHDCWREPYMSMSELNIELDAGVEFWGYESDRALVGVMGIQHVRDVDLVRHAYVLPHCQRHGIGAALIRHLRNLSELRMLVGTWAAATWAVAFYERHHFKLVPADRKEELLRTYWAIHDRQIEASVVLANPSIEE
jgi:GNAT superfamily N-acetyltransferase